MKTAAAATAEEEEKRRRVECVAGVLRGTSHPHLRPALVRMAEDFQAALDRRVAVSE